MSLKDIQCTCPDCGAEFSIDKAIGEQTLARVQAEVAQLSDQEIELKILSAKELALEQGKELAKEQMREEVLKQSKEVSSMKQKLDALELEKLRIENEKTRLHDAQETAVALALQKQELLLNSASAKEKRRLELQVETLKADVLKASERAEQGSMQAQGEASELLIEDTLRNIFPRDEVSEIKKGQRGADCVLTVRNSAGRPVGKINIESKQTKNFSNEWLKKLKDDSLSIGAHFSVLVTSTFPNDNKNAHLRDGVWVCGFGDYQILLRALRNSLIDLSNAVASESVREEKAQIMFDFLTSQEFAGTIERMVSPILRMQEQLNKEKSALTRIWKEREALIEGSITGAENLYYKIQGIAQVNLPKISGLETVDALGFEILDEKNER
ncbi:DUF2130 domain-containing protein [Candidatus Ponderosibacter sp. Uisw_141_02]|uniref:DUF2130 domain-containing protein n=1 Tax=Candidatus Ponderosibacter sp. Uisw_141_02 TaxID=3231000 RepID=UPI003D3A4367